MVDILMPQFSERPASAKLVRRLKWPGDYVQRDEPLFEISTDTVDTEVPSPASGVLSEVLVEAGTTVAFDTVVAKIMDGSTGREGAHD